MNELRDLLTSLLHPAVLVEFVALAACLGAAWLLVRLLAGRRPDAASIWFGERLIDGVLFPVAALAFTLAARWALAKVHPIALFQLAVPLLSSLVIIRVGVRVLRVAFPSSRVVRVIERTLSWVVWLGLVGWLTGALPLALEELDKITWKVGGSALSLRNLIEGVLSALVVLLLALWLSAAIEARLLRDGGRNMSLRKIAANVTRVLLMFVGLLLALSAAGIPLTALSVFGGAVGVGIGFGLQKLASNYVSGFVILAERSLNIGDMVKVDNFEGRVTDINTRYTVLRALNGREANVPNEMLITQRVENYTRADPKLTLTSTVLVAYGTDLEAVRAPLLEAVAAVPRVLAEPKPELQLSAFGLEGIELAVQFVIEDPLQGTANVRSDVNFAVWRTLRRLGVQIPQPRAGVPLVPPPAPDSAA